MRANSILDTFTKGCQRVLRNFGVKPNFRICGLPESGPNQWFSGQPRYGRLWHRHCL